MRKRSDLRVIYYLATDSDYPAAGYDLIPSGLGAMF